jgi:glycine oxidase
MNTHDAVVAGGGVIGASIALELAETGMKVALYDAREPGREASWASAGMISPAPESPEMIVFAPLSLASVRLYPEFIRKVEYLTGMDVGYRKHGALSVSIGGGGKELSTAVALQQSVGL